MSVPHNQSWQTMHVWFKQAACPWEAEIHLNGVEHNVLTISWKHFYTILKFQQKLAFASLSSCLSRIKVGVFKDRLFYILNGFSVEMVFTNQVNPTLSKGISGNVMDLGNFELNGGYVLSKVFQVGLVRHLNQEASNPTSTVLVFVCFFLTAWLPFIWAAF